MSKGMKWSKKKVLAEIQAFYKAKGTLRYREVSRSDGGLCRAAGRCFGSWRKAVEAAGFNYDRFLLRRKWTKEKVISEIQAFYKAKGTSRYTEVHKGKGKLCSAAGRCFGSWRKAVEVAGFDYEQFPLRRKWTKEKVISEIRSIYRTNGTLRYKEIHRDNGELYYAARRRFGSWRKAVEVAGFEYVRFFRPKWKKWTKQKVISEIQAFYRINKTLCYMEIQRDNKKLYSAAVRRFGSWRKAVEVAGFDYEQFPLRRKWTKEKVISEIRSIYRTNGTLRYMEMRRNNKELYYAARRCFGSWRKAIEAAGFDYDQFSGRKKK